MSESSKKKVFINGSAGTTGLKINSRLEARSDIQLLTIPDDMRKDPDEVKKYINASDITFLCLPDDAAREAVKMADDSVKIIDASTAHRTLTGWAYGFPELGPEFREKIAASKRTAVPGCHASGFISLIQPLVSSGLLDSGAALSCTSLTGYSGGGKKLIAKYEGEGRPAGKYKAPMPYSLGLSHKHLPEMTAVTGLKIPPIFMPVVGDFYKGMLVTVPVFKKDLCKNADAGAVYETYLKHYEGSSFVSCAPMDGQGELEDGFLDPTGVNDTNKIEIFVFSKNDMILLAARLDNLGKGSSGAAVQCMNIMLGLDETVGLI